MAATAHTHCCCGGPTPPAEFACCRETAGPLGACDMQTAADCFAAGGFIVEACGSGGTCFESTQLGKCLCPPLSAAPPTILWFLTQPIRYFRTCLDYSPQQNWDPCNNVSNNNLLAALEVWTALARLIPITTWQTNQPCSFNYLFPLSYPSACLPGQNINSAVQATGSVSFNFQNQCFINGGMSSSIGFAKSAAASVFGVRHPTGCGCYLTNVMLQQNAQLQEVPILQCPQNMGCINTLQKQVCTPELPPVVAELVW